MNILSLLGLLFLLMVLGKGWRYFLEFSDDFGLIRLLEPWYWFVFLNLALSAISAQYDYQFVLIGLLIQLVLSAWFAISIGWIIQACPHKTAVMLQSWFVKGKTLKFCYRCGTKMPKDFHSHVIKDNSWTYFLFQIPPHLLEYLIFWMVQSMMVLISLFLVLRFLNKPGQQHEAVLVVVILVILVPPFIYFLGRFRKYLSETKGLIWWVDFKSSLLTWVLVLFVLWGLTRFFIN